MAILFGGTTWYDDSSAFTGVATYSYRRGQIWVLFRRSFFFLLCTGSYRFSSIRFYYYVSWQTVAGGGSSDQLVGQEVVSNGKSYLYGIRGLHSTQHTAILTGYDYTSANIPPKEVGRLLSSVYSVGMSVTSSRGRRGSSNGVLKFPSQVISNMTA